MATVAYFEGTDPGVLTRLAVKGINTMPVSNGFDGHGKYINHIGKGEADVVVAYVHKLMPIPGVVSSPSDILFACRTHNIPVLFVAPRESHNETKAILGEVADLGKIVAPEDLFDEIMKIIQ
ncbi:hypothetical protein J7K18_03215 [bacterium]|nr:hypothetical protein [bacterium]